MKLFVGQTWTNGMNKNQTSSLGIANFTQERAYFFTLPRPLDQTRNIYIYNRLAAGIGTRQSNWHKQTKHWILIHFMRYLLWPFITLESYQSYSYTSRRNLTSSSLITAHISYAELLYCEITVFWNVLSHCIVIFGCNAWMDRWLGKMQIMCFYSDFPHRCSPHINARIRTFDNHWYLCIPLMNMSISETLAFLN